VRIGLRTRLLLDRSGSFILLVGGMPVTDRSGLCIERQQNHKKERHRVTGTQVFGLNRKEQRTSIPHSRIL
jgi:hypothetical protein